MIFFKDPKQAHHKSDFLFCIKTRFFIKKSETNGSIV